MVYILTPSFVKIEQNPPSVPSVLAIFITKNKENRTKKD